MSELPISVLPPHLRPVAKEADADSNGEVTLSEVNALSFTTDLDDDSQAALLEYLRKNGRTPATSPNVDAAFQQAPKDSHDHTVGQAIAAHEQGRAYLRRGARRFDQIKQNHIIKAANFDPY